MISLHLKVNNIEEAWIRSMSEIMNRGRLYRKDGGSRAGMLRKSMDLAVMEIDYPETRPLIPLPKPGCISPCSEEDVEKYLMEYLYNPEPPAEHESYTYAQYLTQLVHLTATHYAKNGLYVQQAVMPVGEPMDVGKYLTDDPDVSIPCLRLIDTRIITENGANYLHYYVYFRAWNHFGAMPLNLAGIQMLKEVHALIIASLTGEVILPGPTVAMSKDLHINEIEWDAAIMWLGGI